MNKGVHKQKQAGLAVAAAFAFAALVPTQAVAAPVSVVAGDIVQLYDVPNQGSTPGGVFRVDVVGKGTSDDFRTFCLEYNETFSSYGQPLKVGAVSFGAVNGGISGGNPDLISNETAWLYTNFSNGTLAGYSYSSNASGNSLQRAIWFLEGELGATYTEAQLDTLDSQAQDWVDLAQASGWTDVHQVRVLNLLKKDSHGNYTLNSQDQLYITPIPEPETYAMLLAGLGLLGFVARRRRQRGAA
jgi:hypothetical protein